MLRWAIPFFVVLLFATPVYADNATTTLQDQIDDHQQKIKALENEIAAYQQQLNVIGTQKTTLKGAIDSINISTKKVSANITMEQQQIGSLSDQIAQLDGNISDKEAHIAKLKESLSALIAGQSQMEDQTMAEAFFKSGSIADMWNELDATQQIDASIELRTSDLKVQRDDLAATRAKSDAKRKDRVSHENALVAQKKALTVTKQEKQNLLAETNNKESSYQKLIAEKQAAKAEFESSLNQLESQLKYTLDVSRLPPVGKGVLAWPLDDVFITQKFGNTDFSRAGAYNGQGHNGVDFRASIGTPIKAALAGTVIVTGNTDGGGCYSYGKWILIKHGNGLSTLYGHLSSIMVSQGQEVDTRQIIGLSGMTGYATGPHLHLSLFASDAVQVTDLGKWYRDNGKPATSPCAQRGAIIPVAPLNAYLDPLEYL